MKVYISGKIGEGGISETTRQKFARAEEMLKAKGYEVFNPCDEGWQKALERGYENVQYLNSACPIGEFPDLYGYCLLRDLMVLSTKDAVYMLADWKRSPDATAEYHFALATGKKLLFRAKDHAFDYLKDEFFAKLDGGQLSEDQMKMPWNEVLNQYIHDRLDEVWLPVERKETDV